MYDDAFETFPAMETERLVLRRLDTSDADDIFEYARDQEAFVYTDGFPGGYEEIRQAIGVWNHEAYQSKQYIRWGIELKAEKKIIGGIYLFLPCGDDTAGRRMDLGYEISGKYWSRGYATEAIKAVIHYGFKNMGLIRIQALIVPENKASIRACEKSGFKYEGTLRNYCHYRHHEPCLKTMVMMACIPEDVDL